MSEPLYIQIHCETKRRKDMRWRYRSVNLSKRFPPGLCYARRSGHQWRCMCCGKAVRVAW